MWITSFGDKYYPALTQRFTMERSFHPPPQGLHAYYTGLCSEVLGSHANSRSTISGTKEIVNDFKRK